MSTTTSTAAAAGGSIDMKLEVVVVPVSDVDRAKRFYASLGWRADGDFGSGEFRVIQFTPPGSGCSVIFGRNVTPAQPGSAQGLYLAVSDIEAARAQLQRADVEVGPVFHPGDRSRDADRHQAFLLGTDRVPGADPQNRSYYSFASFQDPDGNGWLLQQVTTRAPGRVDPTTTTFASTNDLAAALRRAEAAHGKYEARLGHRDEKWPEWYAAYLVAEQAGTDLPS